jgi:acyl-coenzyme A thioesterase 13
MSSRLGSISASASSSLDTHSTPLHSGSEPVKAWVDPASLPDYGVDPSSISGNVPDYVKQLNSNTYFSYGVGDEDCFGHQVGKTVKFIKVNVDRRVERQDRLESTTVAEVLVTKRKSTITPVSI